MKKSNEQKIINVLENWLKYNDTHISGYSYRLNALFSFCDYLEKLDYWDYVDLFNSQFNLHSGCSELSIKRFKKIVDDFLSFLISTPQQTNWR